MTDMIGQGGMAWSYQSICASFEENALRHERRAAMWMEQGKPDYARGSLAKAERNREQARKLRGLLSPRQTDDPLAALVEARLATAADAVMRRIEADIFGVAR
jgi:hypothetical protein